MNRDKEYIRNGYWFMCVSVLMFLVLFHFGSSQLVQYPYIMYAKDYVNSSSLTDFSAIVSLNQSQDYTPYIENAVACYLIDGDASDSCGSNDGTVNNATLTTDRFGDADSAYSFDGTTSKINLTSLKLNYTNTTFSFWIYPTNISPQQQLFGNTGDLGIYGFVIHLDSSDGKIRTQYGNGSKYSLYKTTSVEIANDKWYHVVVVFEENSAHKIYINGTEKGMTHSQGVATLDGAMNWSRFDVKVGQYAPNEVSYYYYGGIDDIKIFNTSLSSTEIEAIYNSTKSVHYYTTSTGVINTSIGNTSNANITYSSEDYISRLYTNIDTDSSHTGYLWQAEATFDAYEIITNNTISIFNVTIDNTTKLNNETWYLSSGLYNATFSKTGWFNQTIEINVENASSETYTFSEVYDKIWVVYAVDNNGNNLTEFEVNLSNSEYSWLDMWYTYVGYIEVPILSSFSGTTAYYNLSFASIEDGGYFSRVYLQQSTASDFVAELHQAEIRFNLTDINSGTPLTPILINNVLSNLTEASSQSNTWSIKKVFQTNATLVPYATSTLRMSRDDYSAELIHEFFYNDSSQVNTSTLSTTSLTDVEYTILNPYPDKLVDTVKVWLRRGGTYGTAYSNYTYVYSGDEYTGSTIYASAGEQSFYFVLRPYFDLNQTIDILALSNDTIDLEMYTNEIWLYGTRSQVLENFTCTYEGNVMYSNPYRISNILTPASNMTCTKSGFKPATVSPSTSTPANDSFYLDELTTTSFPIYVYDERNLTEISNVTLYVFGEEPYVFNWTNSSRTIAVNGSGVTGMLFIKDGYINEEYYIDIFDVYGYINVYMLPANASFNTTFTLQDNINTPIRDGFVDIYRFHPSLVSYILVTTAKTDQNGNATIPLELNAFYKVKTRQVLSSIPYNAIDFPFMPASTEFLVRYGLTEAEQNSAIIFMNMVYNLSYSKNGLNQTIFKLTFNDLSGIVRSGCLKVIEKGVTTNIPLCTNCLNASAGEILCVINQSDYVNTISGWGEFDTTTIHSKYNTPAKDVLKEEGYLDLGTAGLFVTFLLTATGLIAGLFISVPVGLMFLVATLILAIGTGLFWMQISSIVSLIILILLIIFKR